jgi:hypothetical protein
MQGHFRAACISLLLAVPSVFAAAQTANSAVLDLHHVLGSGYACGVARPLQFLSEEELVVLAGPTKTCYDHVSDLELVAFSLDGRVLARRRWASTDSGLALVPQRLVLPDAGGVEVLDTNLKTIQTVRVGAKRQFPVITATDTGILSIESNGRKDFFAGTPLRPVKPPPDPPASGDTQIVSTLDGSWRLLRQGNSLVEVRDGARPRIFADLSWVIPPCRQHGLCEADESSTHFQTVLGKRSRVLITSVGSRMPVTGTFGLLPYFRVEIFDLDSGAEVYREEDEFRARARVAVLSPDGDVVVVSDGYTAVVHRLDR